MWHPPRYTLSLRQPALTCISLAPTCITLPTQPLLLPAELRLPRSPQYVVSLVGKGPQHRQPLQRANSQRERALHTVSGSRTLARDGLNAASQLKTRM